MGLKLAETSGEKWRISPDGEDLEVLWAIENHWRKNPRSGCG
jgi:hypothetical protein